MNPLQRILVSLVQLYRWTLSPLKAMFFGPVGRCRYTPSCSHTLRRSERMERGEALCSQSEGFVPAIRGEDSDTIRRPNRRTGHKTPRETHQIPRWTPAFPALPLR